MVYEQLTTELPFIQKAGTVMLYLLLVFTPANTYQLGAGNSSELIAALSTIMSHDTNATPDSKVKMIRVLKMDVKTSSFQEVLPLVF